MIRVLVPLIRHRTLIPLLFARCCPAAVTRFVVTVIVAAVDGRAFRTRSHINAEVLESFSWLKPPGADCNSPSAVIGVITSAADITASPHCSPRFPERMLPSIVFNLNLNRYVSAWITVLCYTLYMCVTISILFSLALTVFSFTYARWVNRQPRYNRGVAVSSFALIMHPTQNAARFGTRLITSWISAMSGSLGLHREIAPSGVMGRAATTACPSILAGISHAVST